MANNGSRISEMPLYSVEDGTNIYLPIVDAGEPALADQNKKIFLDDLAKAITTSEGVTDFSRVGYFDSIEITPTSDLQVSTILGTIDGKLLGGASNSLYESSDGYSWTLVQTTGFNVASTLYRAYQMGDGEVLLNLNKSLVRSNGWPTNPSTATWSTVQTVSGVDEVFHQGWGVSVAGSWVYATEYGLPKPAAFSAYLSIDDGKTFSKVFDLEEVWTGRGVTDFSNSHNHGCAIDPWHEVPRLWQLTADSGTIGLWWSDDQGDTWNLVDKDRTPPSFDGNNQPNITTITPTPEGILLGTDGTPSGLIFIPRDSSYDLNPRAYYVHQFHDGASTLTHFAHDSLYHDGVAYVGFRVTPAHEGSLPPRILAFLPSTREVFTVWEDTDLIVGADFRTFNIVNNTMFGMLQGNSPLMFKAEIGASKSFKRDARSQDSGNVLGGISGGSFNSIALGMGSEAGHADSVAIGTGASTTRQFQVALGSKHLYLGNSNVTGVVPPPGGAYLGVRVVGESQQLVIRFANGRTVVIAEDL